MPPLIRSRYFDTIAVEGVAIHVRDVVVGFTTLDDGTLPGTRSGALLFADTAAPTP